MKQIEIGILKNRTAFEPGSELEGAVSWNLDTSPEAVEVRLFWFTSGKGTRDAEGIETVRFDQPPSEDIKLFRFRLPPEPYSFSGKLITLTWAVEIVVKPSEDSAIAEFTMAPGGREVALNPGE